MDIRTMPEALALVSLLNGTKKQKSKWKKTLTEYEKKQKRKALTMGLVRHFANTGVGRNSPCPCGSGIKYKKCHLPRIEDHSLDGEIILEELGLRIKEKDDEIQD